MKLNRVVWCLVLLFAASACFAQMYTLTDLGTLGGSFSNGLALNNSGDVVGESTLSNGYLHAFLYRTGKMTDLGLPILECSEGGSSIASGINDSGQIVGSTQCIDGTLRGWIMTDGIAAEVPTPWCEQPGTSSSPWAINAFGQAAGSICNGTQGFLYDSKSEMLTTFGTYYTSANAINRLGQITGVRTPSSNEYIPFLYSDGIMTDLPIFPGGNCNSGCSGTRSMIWARLLEVLPRTHFFTMGQCTT